MAISCVKLPKLTLRSFNGDITKWTSFWDSYESAIHNNGNLSDIDKFNYLNSLLEPTARDAVSGLALTAANYHEAISILKKRFGNKQQIISKHMDILFNVNPVTSQSIKAISNYYDLVESHIRSLKSLGVASETYSSLLSPVLLNKLPTDLRLIVSREISEEDWNIDALLKVVEREIEACATHWDKSSTATSTIGEDSTNHHNIDLWSYVDYPLMLLLPTGPSIEQLSGCDPCRGTQANSEKEWTLLPMSEKGSCWPSLPLLWEVLQVKWPASQ